MKAFYAFIKKELQEQLRTGRLTVLAILFALFGVMNPAIAKLTPWLLEAFANSLEGSGMTVTAVTVTALDSWMQFFKNMPIALIIFVLLEGGIFTKEYTSGTLTLSLTKGLGRRTVVLAKSLVLLSLWTAGFWLCYGITYGYSAFFWENAIAKSLGFSAFCWYLFGVFTVALTILFSVLSTSWAGVFLGVGGTVLSLYLVGLLPKAGKYMPTFLASGNTLVHGTVGADSFIASLFITAALCVLLLVASIPIFDKKQL